MRTLNFKPVNPMRDILKRAMSKMLLKRLMSPITSRNQISKKKHSSTQDESFQLFFISSFGLWATPHHILHYFDFVEELNQNNQTQ
jgi:hypothetical protein